MSEKLKMNRVSFFGSSYQASIILQNGANILKFCFKLIKQMIFRMWAKFVNLTDQQAKVYSKSKYLSVFFKYKDNFKFPHFIFVMIP